MRLYSQPFGTLTEYVLQNPATGDTVSILPAWGGIIRSLILHKNGVPQHLIRVADTEAQLRAERGFSSTHLFPWPSRIAKGQYAFEGKAYQLPVNEVARQNAIHGLVHHDVFEVVVEEADAQAARLVLRTAFAGTPGYPFPFELTIAHQFTPDGRLTLSYSAHNTGSGPMPMGLAWHPYFYLDVPIDTMQIGFPAEAIYHLDTQMIPVAKDFFVEAKGGMSLANRTLDTPFSVHQSPDGCLSQVTSPGKNVTLNVWQETGTGKFNWLVVFTPPQRDRIAIEPMTCNVNAFNSGEGLLTLAPGGRWGAACGVYLS